MKKNLVIATLVAVALLLWVSPVEAQTSQKVASAKETAARYGVTGYHAPAPRPPAQTAPKTTLTPTRTTPKTIPPISVGVGYSRARMSSRNTGYGIPGYGYSPSYGYGANHRTSGRSDALSIAVGLGNALVGAPIDGTGIMPPLMGGYGGGYRSSEAEAYRRGYEEERRRQQRDAERQAEQAGRTDAREGVWRPHFTTPGEQSAYRRGYERETQNISRENERAARDAGRNAARNQSGWGW